MNILWAVAAITCTISLTHCQNCGSETKDRRMTVKGVNDAECLRSVMYQQKGSGLKIITLQDVGFVTGFPEGAFNAFEFETYNFQRFKMRSFNATAKSPFQGVYKKIKKIAFLEPRVALREWKWTHLAELQLEHLIFYQFSEGQFASDSYLPSSFHTLGGPSVRQLEIVSSCLKGLAHLSLSTFTNLEKLSLAGNQLKTIPRRALPEKAPYLKIIDLSRNDILCLDPANYWQPNKYPQVEEIRLEYNPQLKAVFEHFQKGTRVKHIYMNGNEVLECKERLAWVVRLNSTFWERQGLPPTLCIGDKPLKNQKYDDLMKRSDCVTCPENIEYGIDNTINGPCD